MYEQPTSTNKYLQQSAAIPQSEEPRLRSEGEIERAWNISRPKWERALGTQSA